MPLDTTLLDLDRAPTILNMRAFFKKTRLVGGENIGAEVEIFQASRGDQLHQSHYGRRI